MSTEIELKFMLLPAKTETISAWLAARARQPVEKLRLTNCYYETVDNDLRKQGIGLRIRGDKHGYEMTLKHEGDSLGGLSQRSEYNVPLKQPQLDLSLLPANIWATGQDIEQLQQDLRPLFSTHFSRECYLFDYQESRIEAAIDQGEICASGHRESILELELELIHGNCADLLAFAWLLHPLAGLRMAIQSKAARGYRLAVGKNSKPQMPFTPPTLAATLPLAQGIVNILSALQHEWYQQIELWLVGEYQLQDKIYQAVIQIRQVITLFSSLVPTAIANRAEQALKNVIAAMKERSLVQSLLQQEVEQICYGSAHLTAQLAVIEWCYHATVSLPHSS